MKTTDIQIGGTYAYSRRNDDAVISPVHITDTGNYGTLAKWHPRLNSAVFAGIRERAGLAEDTQIFVSDENARVAIQRTNADGSLSPTVELVSPRHIKRTWDDEVVRQERENRDRDDRRARAEAARIQRAEDNIMFHSESAFLARLLQSLGVISDVEVSDIDHYGAIRAKGATFANGDRSGYPRERGVTLSRDAVKRLSEVLDSMPARVARPATPNTEIDERNAV